MNYAEMAKEARAICEYIGCGIVTAQVAGKTVKCKTRWSRKTSSGRAFVTSWSVDGKPAKVCA